MWGMEKGKHYLSGRRFRLITNHKAITYYHTKDDFGNARISHWYEKLRHYNFYVIYKKGEEMTAPDALSRAFIVSKRVRKARSKSLDNSERDENILKYHAQVNHRKTILLDLKEQGIELSAPELAKVLGKCRTCLERDDKYVNSSTYVETSEPGEK